MIDNELTNKTFGLTGKEKTIHVHHDTFCSICQHKVKKGEEVILSIGDNQWKYFIHIDCAVKRMTQVHNSTFRKDVKVKNKPRKTRKNKKVVKQGPAGFCNFCAHEITEDDTYVNFGKKNYHEGGRNSCLVRFRRVDNIVKNSLW